MSGNTIQVALRIMDFECDPEELTHVLGVQPTKIWRKGERKHPKLSLYHSENGWSLSSGASDHQNFDEHTESLLRLIEPRLEAFISIGNQYFTQVSCAIRMYHNDDQSLPWIAFNTRAMRILNQIGAEIDVDLYIM